MYYKRIPYNENSDSWRRESGNIARGNFIHPVSRAINVSFNFLLMCAPRTEPPGVLRVKTDIRRGSAEGGAR